MRWLDERGQAMVELALVLPVLLLLLLGVIETSRALHAYLAVENAAREGARAATLERNDDSQVRDRVLAVTPELPADEVTVTVDPPAGGRASGNAVTVTVDYLLPIYAPMIGALLGNPFPVHGSSTMRVE